MCKRNCGRLNETKIKHKDTKEMFLRHDIIVNNTDKIVYVGNYFFMNDINNNVFLYNSLQYIKK